ncbi:MAG: SUF system Fe-S cluster assembly regulator [Ghiorsea sp.]
MLRLSKMTDYGVLLMSELAKDADHVQRAPDLADATHIPQPTVRKVMTALIQSNMVESSRGVNGGYRLQRNPSEITVRELIHCLEGHIALTDCETSGSKACEQSDVCGTRKNWLKINQAMRDALQNISLKDMLDANFTPIFTMQKVVPIRLESTQIPSGAL